jgi:hypothetical protein
MLKGDIETIDVTINNYERMHDASAAWQRIKKHIEAQDTAHNKQSKCASQIAARLSNRIICNKLLSQSLRDYVEWEVRQLLTLSTLVVCNCAGERYDRCAENE